MTLAKEDLVRSVSDRCGFSKEKSRVLVGMLLELLRNSLESGDDILISGFGKFCTRRRVQGRGRSSRAKIEARGVISFKCSRVLRDRINCHESHAKMQSGGSYWLANRSDSKEISRKLGNDGRPPYLSVGNEKGGEHQSSEI